MWRLLNCLFWIFLSTSPILADILEPVNSVIPLSVKPYFLMGDRIPRQEWWGFDHKSYVAITNISHDENTIYINGQALISKPSSACSIYDSTVCYNVSNFYNSSYPQFITSGFYSPDADTIISAGLNSGFSSPKLTLSPHVMVGIAKRFYVGDVKKRNSHIIVEDNSWLGGSVKHRPCYDSFDRTYYCANLSAWSDFNYQSSEQAYSIFIWYEKLF